MIRPVIGIASDIASKSGRSDSAFAPLTYVEALRASGAIAVILPPQPENAASLLEGLDGLLLAGGADCDPAVYGEARHATVKPMDPRRQSNDLSLAALAREQGVPALGICLGLQMMNVSAGGTLIQDIDSHLQTDIRHSSELEVRRRHAVAVHPETHLSSILGARELEVNSSHHQAVGRLGKGFRVTAHAPDGIVEGIEDPDHPFYLGVQWHPEDMRGEPAGDALFLAFVAAARKRAELKKQATEMSPAVAGRSE